MIAVDSQIFSKKNINPLIGSTLKLLFNRVLEEEFYPECWKLAETLPIHKIEKKGSNRTYRQISLLIDFFFENEVFGTIRRVFVKTIKN